MGVLLIILGILACGAIVIAAYVVTVAAGNYGSEDSDDLPDATAPFRRDGFVMRKGRDRRRGVAVQFPINMNGAVVPRDRRQSPERRSAA
jgi:hypothetical protein